MTHRSSLTALLAAVLVILGCSADVQASQVVRMQVDTLSVVEEEIAPEISGEGAWRSGSY